jgi:hypothetical protein
MTCFLPAVETLGQFFGGLRLACFPLPGEQAKYGKENKYGITSKYD